jgi:prepilin-type N-terminal cleavage/methylation domain-containing protein
MKNEGVTLIELLVVIIVISIIASFSLVSVGNIIENAKEDSFLNTANTMIDSSKNAFMLNDSLWDDDKATMQELIDNDYLEVSEKDPWGRDYDKENSYVLIEEVVTDRGTGGGLLRLSNGFLFKVRLISPTATIGFDIPLSIFDETDVLYIDNDGPFINGIIESITGELKSAIAGDNDNDQITTDSKIGKNGSISTFGGDDIIVVGGEISNNAVVDSGSGNDSITLEGPMKGKATVNSGEGDDTLILPEVRYLTEVDAGSGDDSVTIDSVTSNFQRTVDMGSGDDILTINAEGLSLDAINNKSIHFIGGEGNDILNLPNVTADVWEVISSMFTGFETIYLSDATINN